jgi:hypothetical protein
VLGRLQGQHGEGRAGSKKRQGKPSFAQLSVTGQAQPVKANPHAGGCLADIEANQLRIKQDRILA